MKNNPKYLQIFRENGQLIHQIKQQLVDYALDSTSLIDIDKLAQSLIEKAGGEPAFKKVRGYHYSTCISVNDAFVHGIPQGKLKTGDLVTIDTGMYYHGTTTDTAVSFVVGKPSQFQQQFLQVGLDTLEKTIAAAKLGNRIYDLSHTMQTMIEAAGYNVTRTLTGHGVGRTMHEPPAIPCFVSNDPDLQLPLQEGMVLAVEVMYMAGNWPLKQDNDGWTLRTKDGSLSAVFEEDIIITKFGPELIT